MEIEIPINTRDDREMIISGLVAKCVNELRTSTRVGISWQETSQEMAREVARLFIAKGYHALDYIVRGSGWSYTEISTYVPKAGSEMMSYTVVLG